MCGSTIFTWQAYNALFIIRNLCKYFVENLAEDVVLEQFRTVVVDGNVSSLQVSVMLTVVVDGKVSSLQDSVMLIVGSEAQLLSCAVTFE